MKRKKREFESSDLVKSFAKIYGFEDKLKALEVKNFLSNYLDEGMFSEIEQVNLRGKILSFRIKSPLIKNDFRLRKSFFLKKFNEYFGEGSFDDIVIF